MCGYFSIGFINFMLKGKSLLEYTDIKKKALSLSIVYSNCVHEYEKYLKKKNQLKY